MGIDSKLFLDYIKKVNKDIKGEIILIGDDFRNFLKTISYNNAYIGFYEENTKNAYFFIEGIKPTIFCDIIYDAWQLYNKNDNIISKCYYWKLKIKNNKIKVCLRNLL